MKKILLFILLSSFTTYSQKNQQEPTKVVATVQSQIGEVQILQPSNPAVSYVTPAGDQELEKEYVFWLRVNGCYDCRTRQAEIIAFAFTTMQAQKDQEQAAKEVKQLTHQIKKQ